MMAGAVSRFGAAVKAKLSGNVVSGEPEDQLRAPFEALLSEMAGVLGFKASEVIAVGEASQSELKIRPDYAISLKNCLVGFVELKAPGKGADPRRFRNEHDRKQWEKLKSLPNLVYTDGNAFSLWRDGRLHGEIVRLEGDVETSGAKLAAPPDRAVSVANDKGAVVTPVRYGFRSFDRQWIIPDSRVLNQPNPTLWAMHSTQQIYLTALMQHSPTSGPAVTCTALIPDLHHYKGSFGGRAFPLWGDAAGTKANVSSGLLSALDKVHGLTVTPQDLIAYIAAVAAHPGYVTRFAGDLVQPGLRIQVTAEAGRFVEAVELGREIVWLHTFGERFAAPGKGRPARVPRLPEDERPHLPADGAIPSAPEEMPNAIFYDAARRRLHVGAGHVDEVPPEVWTYEVSGKQVLTQWFSYRCRDRSRPIIGDRRAPSPLGDIQPPGWLAEYTTELLNVLGRLVALEPRQADLLDRICAGPMIPLGPLKAAIEAGRPADAVRLAALKRRNARQVDLLDAG